MVVAVVQLGDKIGGKFRLARIQAWLNPESQAQDKGFQTLQALYAIGSGGIWGKGLGQSMQKLSFLPEAQNDMIFSIICEELGLFGAVAIILMFIMLLWRMMVIANNAPDLFGAMLVVGVMGHIAIQAILKHCRSYQLHSQHRNFPAVYQLRWFFGIVFAVGDRTGIKRGAQDPVKRAVEKYIFRRHGTKQCFPT